MSFLQDYLILTKGRNENIQKDENPKSGFSIQQLEIANLSFKEANELQALSKENLIAPILPFKAPKKICTSAQEETDLIINSEYSGKGVKIGFLDSGIDSKHKAFEGITIIEEDFTGEGNGDNINHGTPCAGICFGRALNSKRIGIATGVSEVFVAKVIDNGVGDSGTFINGLIWAFSNDIDIISIAVRIDFSKYIRDLLARDFSLELSTSIALQAYRSTVRLFDEFSSIVSMSSITGKSSLVFAASGNESAGLEFKIAKQPPSTGKDFITVGAVEKKGTGYSICDFSNSEVDLVAPGKDILTVKAGGGTTTDSGTSLATGFAAGVAALWVEKLRENGRNPGFKLIKNKILGASSYSKLNAGFNYSEIGSGIIELP